MRTIVVIGSNEELNRSVRMAKEPKDVVIVETKINPFGIRENIHLIKDFAMDTLYRVPVKHERKSHRRPYKYHK